MNYQLNKNIAMLIERLGITPYDFSKKIGNKRPDNIYNVINCKVQVSPKTLDKIISTFPDYKHLVITGVDDESAGEGEMTMSAKQHILQFLEYLNIGQAAFEKKVGISNGYVNNLKGSIGSTIISKISSAYPELNSTWLLTGEGEMLKGKDADAETPPAHTIRYWVDVEATAGGVQLFDDLVTSNHIDISIPEFRDCTDAVNLYGDSMLPLYKSGQIIILKEWRESFIDFGNVYLIITKEGNRMVKYLRKGVDDNHLLCTSENKDFDPFDIAKSDVLKLFLVKGSISKNVL